jgi:hypothetical protein
MQIWIQIQHFRSVYIYLNNIMHQSFTLHLSQVFIPHVKKLPLKGARTETSWSIMAWVTSMILTIFSPSLLYPWSQHPWCCFVICLKSSWSLYSWTLCPWCVYTWQDFSLFRSWLLCPWSGSPFIDGLSWTKYLWMPKSYVLMLYDDFEVRDVLYFGVVLFIRIYFYISCLYLLRSCVNGMWFPLHCVFSFCLRSVIIVLVTVYFV